MSQLNIVVFSLLGLISACVGQTVVVQAGQCNDITVPTLTNFNLQNFLGVWYDIESLPSNFQSGTCNTATYSANNDGTVNVQNTEIENGILQYVTGTASVPAGVLPETGRLVVSISGGVPVPYWVLATDYITFALVYSCNNLNANTRQVNIWKLGRNKGVLPAAAVNTINGVITNVPELNAIPSTQYIVRDHTAEACSYLVEFEGACPTTVTGIANFDISRYLGTWYEVARYPQPTQTGQCNQAQYALGATTGVVTVQNSEVINEGLDTILGTATVPGQFGLIQVTLNVAGGDLSQNLYVLATDYDNYALVYSCTNLVGNRRRIGSWQLRKNFNVLDQTAIDNINNAIVATPDLSVAFYQETSQTDAACFYYPEFNQLPSVIELRGSCDTTITGIANFDVNRYLGTWSEVARFPQPTQAGQCSRAEYTAGTSGAVSVVNSQVIEEGLDTISGTATTVAGQSGVLQVTFNVGGVDRIQNLYVLATDYDNYALVYSCTNIEGNRRQVGSWKLRKTTTPLTAEATNAINTAITNTQGLRQDYYQETSQTDAACFYYPEFNQLPSVIELRGPCDTTITGIANFDVNRYLGTWSEVARFPQPTQAGQCSRAEYTAGTSGAVSVVNSQVIDEGLDTISGTATAVAGQSGVLQVTFNVGGVDRIQNLYVLATDYDNYALVYSCTNIEGNRRQVGSWKLRKTTTPLTAEATNAINTAITNTQGLRQDYYQETSQTDAACFYYPEFNQLPSVIELRGPCDTTITGIANFDVNRYLGTWSEVARFPQPTQAGQCSRAEYTAGTSGAVSVVNSQVIEEGLDTISGTATTVAGQSGVLQVTFNVGGVDRIQNLYVLATDYDNYALVYSCTNIEGNRRQVGSWKLRKTTTPLTAEATNAINTAITNTQGLRQDYYQETSQTDAACFYYPEFDQLPSVIELRGPCDTTITGIANFDVNRFLGTWNEVARFPQPRQTGQCNRAHYALGAATGVFSVVNSQVIDEALGTTSGTATAIPGQSGVLQVTFNVGGEVRTENLYVLETDYDNYALVYSCANVEGNRRQVGSWKLRKTTTPLTAEATNAINTAITNTQGLRQDYYQETSQTDAACFYYPVFEQLPSTIELPGPCDTSITGLSDFDVNRYLGAWYEVARYPQPRQTGQCNQAQYTLGATTGVVTVQNSQVINEALGSISGTAIVTGRPGVLQVTFNVAGEDINQDLYVLATDYENYALVYSCANIEGNRRQVGSWKLSRNTNPQTAEADLAIDNVISNTQGLRQNYYQETLQTDAACFYYPVFDQLPPTIELPGPCDTSITGVANFDLNRYLGIWNEVARYPEPTQAGQCNRAQYTAGTSGAVSVVNSQVTNEVLSTMSGTATTVAGQSGVIQVAFTVNGESRTQNLYVLATDYDNYALVYSCTNIEGNRRQVGSWKLSRNTDPLTAAANATIDNVVSNTQGLNQVYYQETSQTDEACWHYLPQTEDKVIIPGQCDTTISGVPNINLEVFANSTWYQIQRYDAVGESTCIGSRLSYDEGYVHINSIEVIDEEAKETQGVARLTTADSGLFTLEMADSEEQKEVYILATDYNGYAIAYSCKNSGTDNRQIGAWQLSRGRTMPAAGVAAVDTLVAERQEFTRAETYFKTISHAGNCPDPSSAFLFKSSIIVIFVCTILQLVW